MVVRVWGTVNSEEVEFHKVPDQPDYWEAFVPRVKGLQDIDIWAMNDQGAVGHLWVQKRVEYHTPTVARLVLLPYVVTLVPE